MKFLFIYFFQDPLLLSFEKWNEEIISILLNNPNININDEMILM